jgi:hypothetical protein
MTRTAALTALTAICTTVAVTATAGLSSQAAEAHYVYKRQVLHTATFYCIRGYAEISHGNGGGYTKLTVGRYNRIALVCSQGHTSPQTKGKARVAHELWKQRSNGSWYLCRASGWKYNPGPWDDVFSNGITYGTRAPCGSGTYGVTGHMALYIDRTWRGGTVRGGTHWLP